MWELREAIADLYNRLYRRGMPSQYTAENVCVSGGGRAALTRAAASLGHVNLGHFLPDYTAYEELLDIFKAFTAIPILLEGERGYAFSVDDLRREVQGRGLAALLLSNPCNPTGKHVRGDELARWVARRARARLHAAARRVLFALPVDRRRRRGSPIPVESAARYVEDVDRDPGRDLRRLDQELALPGLARDLDPRPEARDRGGSPAPGSFLDGGGSKPLQRAAIPLLDDEHVDAETNAIQAAFRAKRDRLIAGLARLGDRHRRAAGRDVLRLGQGRRPPPPLDDGMGFFRAALEKKVITVPGEFFDVNPGKRRSQRASRFRRHVRFSFGPAMDNLETALGRLETLIKR